MIGLFWDLGRYLKMQYYLMKYGVSMTVAGKQISLRKGNLAVTLVKEGSIIDNYLRVISSASWLNVGAITEEKQLDGEWGVISYPYNGQILKLAYPLANKESAFIDTFFIQNEFKSYLESYTPKIGDVVIDAGGFHGLFSILISGIVGSTGRIICLEPDEENLKVLKKNIALNGCKNIIVSPRALWNEKARLEFNSLGNVSSTLFSPTIGSAKAQQVPKNSVVEAASIKDIMEEFRLDKIDFIKMDIEGAEIEALEGAMPIIKEQDLHFAIAAYHTRDGKPTFPKVEKILRKAEYSVRTGYPHMTTYAWKRKSDIR